MHKHVENKGSQSTNNGTRMGLGFICAVLLLTGSVKASAAELDYDALIQEAISYRNAGEFAQAEEILRTAATIPEETNEVDFLLAMVVAFQERFIESLEILEQSLERYPTDLQLILGRARVLSFQGVYNEPIEITRTVLEVLPDNIEARNLLGRIYYYQRRNTQAREAFLRVLETDPDNLEALIALYDVEYALGNENEADSYLDQADLVEPGHVDITTRRNRDVVAITRNHEILAGYAFSDIDLPGFQSWYDRQLEYRYRLNSGNQVYVRGEHSHRFGAHDSLVEIGGVIQRANGMVFDLAVAYTADNDFLPENRIRIGTSFILNNASENFGSSTLDLALTRSEYVTGDVQRLALGLTHYFLDFNAWITPGVAVVKDELGERTVGWTVGMNWQTNARLRLGYNYTDAPETENSITTETNSNHIYARYQLSDEWFLRFDLSRIERSNSYTRENIAATLQYQF
jgi:YaiO family outer membrane protein